MITAIIAFSAFSTLAWGVGYYVAYVMVEDSINEIQMEYKNVLE